MRVPANAAIAVRLLLITGAAVFLVVFLSRGLGFADSASFGATDDTYVKQDGATSNFGTAADMDVKSTSTLQHRDTLTHQYVHADRHGHTHDHAYAHAYMAHVSQAGAK